MTKINWKDATEILQPRQADFRLGLWLVRPDRNTLELGAEGSVRKQHGDEPGQLTRALEPRLMQLLCLLAQYPDQVLGREALMHALWPRVVVNENSLTRAVSDLRKQLAMDSNQPRLRYIETVPKRGYRLCVPVCDPAGQGAVLADPATAQAPSDNVAAATASLQRPPPRRGQLGAVVPPQPAASQATGASALLGSARRWLPALAASAASVVLTASAMLNLPANPRSLSQPDVQAQTQSRSNVPMADVLLSDKNITDGNFSSKFEQALALQPLPSFSEMDNGSAGTGEFAAHSSPVVSPDGSLFAYTRYSQAGSSLVLGSLYGAQSPVVVYQSEEFISELQWSPVGHGLLFAQSPMTTSISLIRDTRSSARLMLFDLRSFSATELYRPERGESRDYDKPFKLT